ncbi:hypothetical protein [Massilia aerilata]|uniref:Uncharacterized protein n=1 Tax=Massilia aerilata TaxID=453817 RepID=A0ABW0S2L8_9BURK
MTTREKVNILGFFDYRDGVAFINFGLRNAKPYSFNGPFTRHSKRSSLTLAKENMYKKSAELGLAALLSICAISAQCADKSLPKRQMQTDFISDAKNTISLCNSKYRQFVELRRMNQYAYETGRQADESMARLEAAEGKDARGIPPTKLQETPEYHVLCIEKSKELLLPRTKGFIASFKTAQQQNEAKVMVAQWITAMSSVGKSVGESEAAKFETLANGVEINMQ